MALHWDATKVKNHKELLKHPTDPHGMNPVSEAIIWNLGLAVGIPEITPKTIDEVHRRLIVLENSGRGLLRDNKGKPKPITRADLEAHMGLRTNGTTMTKAQFIKNIGQSLYERAGRQLEREKQACTASTSTSTAPTASTSSAPSSEIDSAPTS